MKIAEISLKHVLFLLLSAITMHLQAIIKTQPNYFTGGTQYFMPYSDLSVVGKFRSSIASEHYGNLLADPDYVITDFGQVITLDYTRLNKSDITTANWQVTIAYRVMDFDTPSIYEDGMLTISNKNYKDVNRHNIFSSAWKIEITSVQTSGTNFSIRSDIILQPATEIEYYYNILGTATTIDGTSPRSIGNELEIGWGQVENAEEYELQYVFIDNTDEKYSVINAAPSLAFDHPKATSSPVADGFHYKEPVNVVLKELTYRIHKSFPQGILLYRVRPVGRMLDNTAIVSYGEWSSVDKYTIVSNFEGNKVWQSVNSFAEEGKHKEVMTYYDGTMRNRQAITNMSDGSNAQFDDYSLVAETKYDYEGRPVLTMLPAPVNSNIINYQQAFNKNASAGEFTKANFDKPDHSADDPLSTSYGVGQYYASGVTSLFPGNIMHYLPKSYGYAYSRVEYTRDGSGRIRAAGGVGANHQLGSGHETKYFYGTTNEAELRRLFGSNVGNDKHYKKNLTVDPNGQISVAYLDQQGRTVATALAGAGPDNTVRLDENRIDTITTNLMARNQVDTGAHTSKLKHKITNSVPNTIYNFTYDITGVINIMGAGAACKSCVYDLKIYVTNPDGNYLTLSVDTAGGPVNRDSVTRRFDKGEIAECASTPDSFANDEITFSVVLPEVGEYYICKELTLASGELSVFFDWALNNLSNWPDSAAIYNEYLSLIDSSICDVSCTGAFKNTCIAELTAEDPEAWEELTQPEKDELVKECIDNKCNSKISAAIDSVASSTCKSYLEQMIQSIEPERNGQLNYIWWDLDSMPPFTVNKRDTPGQYVVITLAMLKDTANFQLWWADSLVSRHREYCHYKACVKQQMADRFEKELARQYTFEQAEDIDNNFNRINFYTVVNGMHVDSVKRDPFFASLPGSLYAANMTVDLYNFKGCTPVISMEDYFAYSTTQYPCSAGTTLPQTTAAFFYAGLTSPADDSLIAVRHWQLMRSTYIDLRRKYIRMAMQIDENCTYFTDNNAIVDNPTGNMPTNNAEGNAFLEQIFPSDPGSTCRANVAGWKVVVMNECDVSEENFDQYLSNHLYNYCINHYGPSNPMGLLFREDIPTDPYLAAVHTYLNGCDTNITVNNPYAYTLDSTHYYRDSTLGLIQHPIPGSHTYTNFEQCMVAPCLSEIINYANLVSCDSVGYWTTCDTTTYIVPDSLAQRMLPCVDYRHNYDDVRIIVLPDEIQVYYYWSDTIMATLSIKYYDDNGNFIDTIKWSNAVTYTDSLELIPGLGYCGTAYGIDSKLRVIHNGIDSVMHANMVIEYCVTRGFANFSQCITDTLAAGYKDSAYVSQGTFTYPGYYDTCIANLAAQAKYFAGKEYEQDYIDYTFQLLVTLNKCFQNPLREEFYVNYGLNEYHYTLYYYDQAGNLVQTVPPRGVDILGNSAFVNGKWDGTTEPDHKLLSRYMHNSLEGVRWQQTPDAGISKFWYDDKGMLKLSRNAKQATDSFYSFTNYDAQARITIVGQIKANQPNVAINRAVLNKAGFLNNIFPVLTPGFVARLNDMTHTYYDENKYPPYTTNTRGRVVEASVNKDYPYPDPENIVSNIYAYDIHGNVKTMIQVVGAPAALTVVNYRYDLISGKVLQVDYADFVDVPPTFRQRYSYDADNRLREVQSSRQGHIWETDATYQYYPHGPLARIELGHDKVQGLDYYYTIHGWLKGINAVADSVNGTTSIDPGADGGSFLSHKRSGYDQYGLALGYYQGDYERVDGNSTKFADEAIWSNYTADIQAPGSPPGGYKYGLYNGNITYMASSIYNAPVYAHPFTNGHTQTMVYKYDQLNRIKNSIAYNGHGQYKSNNHPYEEYYHYDPNGNIDTLKRYDATGTLIDNLAYRYQHNKKHNQLVHVDDAVSSGVSSVDVDDQGTALTDLLSGNLTGNYQYDEIGNLIQDNAEDIDSIHWNIYGKIRYIKRKNTSTKPDLNFLYNAAGERVIKTVIPKSAPGVIADEADWVYTLYARGADGNVLNMVTSADNAVGYTNEFVIYGSSRLGTWSPTEPEEHIHGLNALGSEYRMIGRKNYELTNHLGNVMATVTDKKLGMGHPSKAKWYLAEVTSAQDYYPFGMLMPGRGYNSPDYRYGFNGKEKDDEVKGSGNQYDYGARIYDNRSGRWLSIDPEFKSYAYLSTYHFSGNNPIANLDDDGEKFKIYYSVINPATGVAKVKNVSFFKISDKVLDRVQKRSGNNAFVSDVVTSFKYLKPADNPKILKKLAQSLKTIKIQEAAVPHDDAYTDANKTVDWDTKSALETFDNARNPTGTQSAALGLYHEIGHAFRAAFKRKEFLRDRVTRDPVFHTKEEEKTIQNYENPAAIRLGEPQRVNHGGNPVHKAGPIAR